MKTRNPYRFAVGVALATALILLWVNGAVGVIGKLEPEDNSIVICINDIANADHCRERYRPIPHGIVDRPQQLPCGRQ